MKATISVALVLVCLACTTRLGEFSIVSRRAAVEEPAVTPVRATELVSGRSCRSVILFFIPLGPRADLSDAFDAALASAPGADALAEVTVRRETTMTLVYNRHCFVVDGKPVTFRRAARR